MFGKLYLLITILIIAIFLSACSRNSSNAFVTTTYVPANQVNIHNFVELQVAADSGDPVAQHKLGGLYYNGLGVSRSHKKALEWWTKSASQGYGPAQYSLGVLYFVGVGIKTDFVEGCKWLGAAASQGIQPAINTYSYKCRKE